MVQNTIELLVYSYTFIIGVLNFPLYPSTVFSILSFLIQQKSLVI